MGFSALIPSWLELDVTSSNTKCFCKMGGGKKRRQTQNSTSQIGRIFHSPTLPLHLRHCAVNAPLRSCSSNIRASSRRDKWSQRLWQRCASNCKWANTSRIYLWLKWHVAHLVSAFSTSFSLSFICLSWHFFISFSIKWSIGEHFCLWHSIHVSVNLSLYSSIVPLN